jgi:type III secretory pathway component EscS
MAIIDSREPAPWYKRLGWLVLIWLGSVVALGVVAGALRMLMQAAGMSSH